MQTAIQPPQSTIYYVRSYKDTAETAATQPSVPEQAANCASLDPFTRSFPYSQIAAVVAAIVVELEGRDVSPATELAEYGL
jgi:hypothetical protein